MVKIEIYIEGGNHKGGSTRAKSRFRKSWREFFKCAGLTVVSKVVAGGGRDQTFSMFRKVCASQDAGIISLLLVDSEGPVESGLSSWDFLRKQNKWERPRGTVNNSAFLMVQTQETWFLADQKSLAEFFGGAIRNNVFKSWPSLENVPKDKVLSVLKKATSQCSKTYSKGEIADQLLQRLDPKQVRQKCPHADKLLSFLEDRQSATVENPAT